MEGTWEGLEEGKRRGNDVSKKKHLDIKPKNRLALVLWQNCRSYEKKQHINNLVLPPCSTWESKL